MIFVLAALDFVVSSEDSIPAYFLFTYCWQIRLVQELSCIFTLANNAQIPCAHEYSLPSFIMEKKTPLNFDHGEDLWKPTLM